MTLSTAQAAFGAGLQYYNGTAYAYIANVTNMAAGGPKSKTTDVTQFQGGGWSEEVPTIISGGNFSCDIDFNSTDATHNAMLTDQLNRTLVQFKLMLPDGVAYFGFSAYITGLPLDLKVSDVVKAKLSLAISGPVTYVSG